MKPNIRLVPAFLFFTGFALMMFGLINGWTTFFAKSVQFTNDTTTTWIGHPMTSDNDTYPPRQGWLPHCQIGLRSDGIVVWKAVTNR